ncbi:MAG: hypothetical protein PHQ04_06015 [Opitutaceae bacterium]|nr:hypothetical protein [Opitutaceae bacterium]
MSDLIENGLEPDQRALVLLAEGEPADAADARLAALKQAEVRRWRWTPPDLPAVKGAGFAVVFFFADPRGNPVDQLEALKPWIERQGARLARIMCVVDCGLAEKNPKLLPWFDACVHFSDVVFVTRRVGVANKWLSTFLKHFQSQHYPCHFLQPREGEIDNPALVLEPEARRVSEYFDEPVELTPEDIEGEEDVELTPEELAPPADPYFERRRNGRRVKEIPDLAAYLV